MRCPLCLLVITLLISTFANTTCAATSATHPATAPVAVGFLDRRLPEVKFEDTPFVQVIERLSNETHTPILVRWRALEALGVEEETPVSLHVWDLPLSEVLEIVLGQFGDAKLACTETEDLVRVSTAEDFDRRPERAPRVYDVTDLIRIGLASVPDPPPDPAPPATMPAATLPSQGQGGGLFGGSPDAVQDQADELVKAVKLLTFPLSWEGHASVIRYWAGRLIVDATPENQRKVAAALRVLRENPRNDGPPGAAILDRRVGPIRFDKTRLAAAIEMLRRRTRANISLEVRNRSGRDPGDLISIPDDCITLNLPDLSLREALRAVLANWHTLVPLDFQYDDGVIMIAHDEYVRGIDVGRVYDVSDLLQAGLAGSAPSATPKAGLRLQQDEFVKMIQTFVAEETWKEGGVRGIHIWAGRLFLLHGLGYHKELATLLRTLREKPSPDGGPALMRVKH